MHSNSIQNNGWAEKFMPATALSCEHRTQHRSRTRSVFLMVYLTFWVSCGLHRVSDMNSNWRSRTLCVCFTLAERCHHHRAQHCIATGKIIIAIKTFIVCNTVAICLKYGKICFFGMENMLVYRFWITFLLNRRRFAEGQQITPPDWENLAKTGRQFYSKWMK